MDRAAIGITYMLASLQEGTYSTFLKVELEGFLVAKDVEIRTLGHSSELLLWMSPATVYNFCSE